jgi:hypothetical protein
MNPSPLTRPKALTLSLSLILVLNTIACRHNNSQGPHTGVPPKMVDVIVGMVSVATEAGVLILTKRPAIATLAGGAAGVGAKYFIDEFDIACKACGTDTAFVNQTLMDAEPSMVKCRNSACKSAAYVIATCCKDRLQQAKETLPPTCLLTKEVNTNNEVKLTWRSHNATSASLNGSSVNPNGSMIITPQETTDYTLKVISQYGSSEDRLTVEVQQIETGAETQEDSQSPQAEPQPAVRTVYVQPPPSPPPPPLELSTPAVRSSRVTVSLNRIEVYEDGSLGGTDWSFGVFANDKNLLVVPKQSFHDGGNNLVQFNGASADTMIVGDEVSIHVRGYNFDKGDKALGTLNLSLGAISGRLEKSLEVAVPYNLKKGDFIFYFTIVRQ